MRLQRVHKMSKYILSGCLLNIVKLAKIMLNIALFFINKTVNYNSFHDNNFTNHLKLKVLSICQN